MISHSIGSGRVSESEKTLTLRTTVANTYNASAEQDIIQISQAGDGNVMLNNNNTNNNNGDGDVKPPSRINQSIIGYEEPIMITQSTHSFLFTERTCSLPFNFALTVLGISYTCLILALLNNLFYNYSSDNPLSVPVGVTIDVKIAQYLSVLIGLIMEEEIPESLYLLRMITEKTLHAKEPRLQYGKFIFCATARILMGILFLLNMFVVVVQAEFVIDIFFDVMALQFLQQLDDICFRLARMDVFGKRMKVSSTRKCFRSQFDKLPFNRRKKMTIFVKSVYIINLALLMAGLTVTTVRQHQGVYHCHSLTVQLGNDIWQDSLVFNSTTGEMTKQNLIYSYFNGVYIKNGTVNGRPIYVEQNKFDDTPFIQKKGALIKYCKEERAWVFMHENIRKDENTKDSNCPWLLRSPETDSFNLLEVSGSWRIWTGMILKGATFSTTCNGCDGDSDCNYHGTCINDGDGSCTCDTEDFQGISVPEFTGAHCEYPLPCGQVQGNDGSIWDISMMKFQEPWMAYGRGVYFYSYGGNITKAGVNDTLVLIYTGSRWYAAVYKDTTDQPTSYWKEYATEFHAFWDDIFALETVALSDPTTRSDPIQVDFYRIGQRGPKFGPFGELLPAQDPPGSGYFNCTYNYTLV